MSMTVADLRNFSRARTPIRIRMNRGNAKRTDSYTLPL